MKTMKLIFSLLSGTFILFSCQKQNESPAVSYQLKTSTTPAAISARTLGGSLQWTAGFANTIEIEFEAENNQLEVEYKSEAQSKIDLFNTLSTLGVVQVPAGVYDDIEFEVEIRPTTAEPALQLTGNYTNSNGVVTPVVLQVNEGMEIESEKENFLVSDGADYTALTTLNLSLISLGVTETMFNNAVRTADGKIVISANSNPDIYVVMRNNLTQCGGVEVDD